MMRYKVPGKHSVFWKLACLLVAFCLLMIWLSWSWGRYMDKRTGFLSQEARSTLLRYASEAERAWESGQQAGVDQWLQALGQVESGWVGVIGQDLQTLSSYPLSDAESQRLTFLRGLDWPVSHLKATRPWIKVPFPRDSSLGYLVIELPQRFMPGRSQFIWRIITNGVIPGLFTLLLCVGLYRLLIVPLNHLREQANAWRADHATIANGRGCGPVTGSPSRARSRLRTSAMSAGRSRRSLASICSEAEAQPVARDFVAAIRARHATGASPTPTAACHPQSGNPCQCARAGRRPPAPMPMRCASCPSLTARRAPARRQASSANL